MIYAVPIELIGALSRRGELQKIADAVRTNDVSALNGYLERGELVDAKTAREQRRKEGKRILSRYQCYRSACSDEVHPRKSGRGFAFEHAEKNDCIGSLENPAGRYVR